MAGILRNYCNPSSLRAAVEIIVHMVESIELILYLFCREVIEGHRKLSLVSCNRFRDRKSIILIIYDVINLIKFITPLMINLSILNAQKLVPSPLRSFSCSWNFQIFAIVINALNWTNNGRGAGPKCLD